MGILAWIVLGAIAGFITNMIMGGGEGVIETIILGIVGAVVGGWVAGTVLNVADVTGSTSRASSWPWSVPSSSSSSIAQ